MLRVLDVEELRFLEAREPTILISSWSSVSITVVVHGFTKHGLFYFTHSPNTNRSLKTEEWRLPAFPILLKVGWTGTAPRRGECYVRVALRLAKGYGGALVAGYLEPGNILSWPPGVTESSVAGRGLLRTIAGTDPAAGAEISETVPTNALWLLKSIEFQLVTDATVTNRRVQLIVDDGTNVLFTIPAGAVQAESETRTYSFLPELGYHTTAFYNNYLRVGIPPTLLFQGWRIRTSTVNLQAGDDYGAPRLHVEEWLQE